MTDKISSLGFILSPNGVEMEPEWVSTILEWPMPKNVKEVQSFLGFANFYCWFIYAYSKITAALFELMKGMKKGEACVPFIWSVSAQCAFDDLKKSFTTAPLLAHFDPSLPCQVEPDVSTFAVAAILLQLYNNGLWHPIVYWSCKLIDAEMHYDTHDKELLAIITSFQNW